MLNNDFFEECTDASRTKQFIVVSYFTAWASIMTKTVDIGNVITYLDLFSGPGTYNKGTESTPLLIMRKIIDNRVFCNQVRTIFNDMNPDYASQLDANLNSLEGVERLRFKPVVYNYEIGSDIAVSFSKQRLDPTLIFIDPCGYEGFSLDLVWSVVKDFGCDCIAFFNYNRINMHLSNDAIPREKLDAILDCDSQQLYDELSVLSPKEREDRIIDVVKQGALAKGIDYTMEFRFKSITNRTSHFLLFFSKSFKGYETMKDVMYKASNKDDDGVANYQFDYSRPDDQLTISFDCFNTLEDLRRSLQSDYQGQTILFDELYEEHSVGKRYVLQNYKKVLREMLLHNEISTHRMPKSGFPLDLIITFP
jgi:three-Cys-motif partner protein